METFVYFFNLCHRRPENQKRWASRDLFTHINYRQVCLCGRTNILITLSRLGGVFWGIPYSHTQPTILRYYTKEFHVLGGPRGHQGKKNRQLTSNGAACPRSLPSLDYYMHEYHLITVQWYLAINLRIGEIIKFWIAFLRLQRDVHWIVAI